MGKINYILLTIAFGFAVLSVSGQFYDQRRSRWQASRHQVGATLGATAFLGELGGADAIGSDGIRDMNLSQVRYAFSLDYRYFITRNFTFRGSFLMGQLAGNDAETNEPFRKNRNLHFRSSIYELTGLLEYFILREEPGRRGNFNQPRFIFDLYVYAGVGLLYFNPKAQYQATWLSLQPLGTEGQGLELQPALYNRLTAVVPVGFGFAKKFKQYWSLGLELGYRLTFSDYLDDVSTVYFNNDKILAERGEAAAYLADPSLGYIEDDQGQQILVNSTAEGLQRGDANDNDAYLNFMITGRFYLAGLNGGRKKTRRSFF